MDLLEGGVQLDIEPRLLQHVVYLLCQLEIGIQIKVDILLRIHPRLC